MVRKVIRVHLTPQLAAKVEAIHDQTGIGESEIMRQALIKFLIDNGIIATKSK